MILRYFLIISIIIGVSLSKTDKFETVLIMLILVFVINNQTRYFAYRDKTKLVFLSIILEWIIGWVIYKNYGGVLITYFIIGIADVYFLIKGYILRGLASILGLGIFVYAARTLPLQEAFSQGVALISLILISSIISLEYGKKEKIEELYDKLKLSEKILKGRNKELKEYSKSLKDLTL